MLRPGRFSVGDFGDKFRKAREAKGISLDDVSNVTKIGSRMLQAIEQEHFDQLPGGVFNKGFIRAYAKHLGLDGEEAVTEYLACLRQAQVDAQAALYEPPRPAPLEKRLPVVPLKPSPKSQAPAEELPELQLPRAEHVRPPRKDYVEKRGAVISWGIVAAVALVAALGVFWWRNQSRSASTAPSASATAPAMSAPSTSAPVASIPVASTGSAPAAPAPASHGSPPVNPPSNTSTHTAPSPALPPARPSPGGPVVAANNEKTVEAAASTQPAAASPKPAQSLLTLVIRASETSWISATADGQTASQEMLIAPAHASIRASREIVVRIGNAAGVSFLFNGQEIPAEGAEGEVRTLVFDSAGMRVVPNQPPVQNH